MKNHIFEIQILDQENFANFNFILITSLRFLQLYKVDIVSFANNVKN